LAAVFSLVALVDQEAHFNRGSEQSGSI